MAKLYCRSHIKGKKYLEGQSCGKLGTRRWKAMVLKLDEVKGIKNQGGKRFREQALHV